MYDRLRWGRNAIYGPNTLELHFKNDDEKIDEIYDRARDKDYTVSICQVDNRDGLTVFIMNVPSTEIHTLLEGENL